MRKWEGNNLLDQNKKKAAEAYTQCCNLFCTFNTTLNNTTKNIIFWSFFAIWVYKTSVLLLNIVTIVSQNFILKSTAGSLVLELWFMDWLAFVLTREIRQQVSVITPLYRTFHYWFKYTFKYYLQKCKTAPYFSGIRRFYQRSEITITQMLKKRNIY